jgi:antitoxin Phd
MEPAWKLQDGKQRFSELIRSALTRGPQVITRHGEEVAVVIDIKEYRRLRGAKSRLADQLLAIPRGEDLLIADRSQDMTEVVDFDKPS